jgi:hypothetical protein
MDKTYLHERFTYEGGQLLWKTVLSNRNKVGQIAGDTDGKGYRRVMLGTKPFKMHRLIWIMFNGDIPEGMVIDHINQDIADNTIENLRMVTKAQNNLNTDRGGVSYDAPRKKWRAQISEKNKNNFLGRFDTREAAVAAYETAKVNRFN